MNRDIVELVLRDYQALRRSGSDPELEAVRAAILLEDVFDIVLSDEDIDPVVFADSSAVAALVAGLRGAVLCAASAGSSTATALRTWPCCVA
jgi:hypothetical protein